MGIEPVGSRPSVVPNVTVNPAAPGSPSFTAQQQEIAAQQQTGGGGGGGHGGGHGGAKKATSAIEEIAARASVKIERRKTPAERQAEIDRLARLAEEEAQRVHERGDERPDDHESPNDAPPWYEPESARTAEDFR
jgi:hypothetical protein